MAPEAESEDAPLFGPEVVAELLNCIRGQEDSLLHRPARCPSLGRDWDLRRAQGGNAVAAGFAEGVENPCLIARDNSSRGRVSLRAEKSILEPTIS